MSDVIWKIFEFENSPIDNKTRNRKLYERYVDDIFCTLKDDKDEKHELQYQIPGYGSSR